MNNIYNLPPIEINILWLAAVIIIKINLNVAIEEVEILLSSSGLITAYL